MACSSQPPDVRSVWRMPGVPRHGEAVPEGARGYSWVYASGRGDSADRASATDEPRGDLPDSLRAPSDPLWRAQEGVALQRARDLQLPLLIDFYAEWCAPCMRMAGETFRDPDLRVQLRQQTVPLQINVTEESSINREQLKRYKVFALPTLLIVSADGRELERYERYVSASELSERLAQLVVSAQPTTAQAQPPPNPSPSISPSTR